MRKKISRIKRGLAVLLSASMVFGMTPFSASAEESLSGNDSVNVTALDDDTESGIDSVSSMNDACTDDTCKGYQSATKKTDNDNATLWKCRRCVWILFG